MKKKTKQGIKIAGLAGAAILVAAALAGCGAKATVGSPSTGDLNNYFAVGSGSNETGTGPHRWAVSLDDSSSYFSAEDLTLDSIITITPMKGTYTTANGFDDFTAQSGYEVYSLNVNQGSGPAGPAIEIPGEAAVLVSPPEYESGSTAHYPVFAVASNKCSSLSGSNNTFQFLELPLIGYANSIYASTPQPLYGSVQGASTANSDGSVSWSFSNFNTTTAAGVNATQTVASGLCANSPTNFGYIVNLSDNSADIAVSPSGYLAWWEASGPLMCVDTTDPSDYLVGNTGPCAPMGYVGFLTPSSHVNTSALVAEKFNGVELNVGGLGGTGSEISRPVSFGATAGTGSTITGGVFPGDDTTKTPDSSISINLGTQSTTSNGFYPSVTVTLANTAAPLSGVAIAGAPGGKNVVYVAVVDGANTLYFFLYQQ